MPNCWETRSTSHRVASREASWEPGRAMAARWHVLVGERTPRRKPKPAWARKKSTHPRTVKNILIYGDAMAQTVRLRLLCIYTRGYSMYTYCLDISAQSVDSHARPPFDAASMLAEGSIEWKMEGPGAAESRRLFLSRGGGPVPSKIPKLSRLWNSRRAEWPARD